MTWHNKTIDETIDIVIMILCWVSLVVFALKHMYLESGVFLIAAKMYEERKND